MTDLGWLLEDVANSPDGPQVAAFFDFDGTLIDGFSAKVYFVDRLKSRDMGTRELIRTVVESAKVERRGDDISRLMNTAIRNLAGRSEDEMTALGNDLFARKISAMVFPGARALVEAHAAKGPHRGDRLLGDTAADHARRLRPRHHQHLGDRVRDRRRRRTHRQRRRHHQVGRIKGAGHARLRRRPRRRHEASRSATATAPRTCRCWRRWAAHDR